MIFQNYSQTYAANITAFAGMVSALLAMFGIEFIGDAQIQFMIGTVLNFGGIIWSIIQRYQKGDVNLAGFKK